MERNEEEGEEEEQEKGTGKEEREEEDQEEETELWHMFSVYDCAFEKQSLRFKSLYYTYRYICLKIMVNAIH